MSQKPIIVLCAAVFALSACGVKHHIIDDAYYYSGDEPAVVVEAASEETAPQPAQQAAPEITYTNVQDTTVTIVIKNK